MAYMGVETLLFCCFYERNVEGEREKNVILLYKFRKKKIFKGLLENRKWHIRQNYTNCIR